MSQTAKTIVLGALLLLVFDLICTIVSASGRDEQAGSFLAPARRLSAAGSMAGVEA